MNAPILKQEKTVAPTVRVLLLECPTGDMGNQREAQPAAHWRVRRIDTRVATTGRIFSTYDAAMAYFLTVEA